MGYFLKASYVPLKTSHSLTEQQNDSFTVYGFVYFI